VIDLPGGMVALPLPLSAETLKPLHSDTLTRDVNAAYGFVYFARECGEHGRIKIGHTKSDPVRRIADLQTGNSRRIELLAATFGDQARERELHAKFAHLRVEGEWFTPGAELVAFVQAVVWTIKGQSIQAERLAALIATRSAEILSSAGAATAPRMSPL